MEMNVDVDPQQFVRYRTAQIIQNEEKSVENKRKRIKSNGAPAIRYLNQPSSESRRSPTNVTM